MFILILLLTPILTLAQDFSFLGLQFGMTQSEIYSTITNSRDLIPAEDPLIVQLIPATPSTVVLLANNSNNNMIQKVFIDFNESTSYQITVFLNPSKFSFYTLSEKMLDLYGIPEIQNSKQIVWYDSTQTRRATLEYPATIKYTDMPRYINVITSQEQMTNQNSPIEYQERQRILNEL